jgi:hypothetical protein
MSATTFRIAGLSGLAYLILLFASVPFAIPGHDSAAQLLAADFLVDRNSVIAGASLRSVGVILFLPFLATLARVTRAGAGDTAGAVASGAGLLLAGSLLLGNTLMAALASRIAPVASPETTHAIYSIKLLLDTFFGGFALAGVAAVSGYAILHAVPGSEPYPHRWAGWVSLAAGAIFLASAPFMANDGFFGPLGTARALALLATLGWIVSLSVALLRAGRGAVAARRLEPVALPS